MLTDDPAPRHLAGLEPYPALPCKPFFDCHCMASLKWLPLTYLTYPRGYPAPRQPLTILPTPTPQHRHAAPVQQCDTSLQHHSTYTPQHPPHTQHHSPDTHSHTTHSCRQNMSGFQHWQLPAPRAPPYVGHCPRGCKWGDCLRRCHLCAFSSFVAPCHRPMTSACQPTNPGLGMWVSSLYIGFTS